MKEKIKRILAGIVDFYLACFFSSAIIGFLTLGKFSVTPFTISIYLILYCLLQLFRDLIFENASIGKRIFKLKVVKIDGTKLTIVDMVKRNMPIIVLVPVEVLLILFDNRRIGDIWAKTLVVYNDRNGR